MAPKHALIIDDNAANLNVLAEMLTLEGLSCTKVQATGNLGTALEKLNALNIVFLDLEMPGTNGYQILEYLSANARCQGIPVVGYSVHISEINTARARGFHSFLGKPLNADDFPDQLARILRGERVWAVGFNY
jgi:CheY-like chemotaxis protein